MRYVLSRAFLIALFLTAAVEAVMLLAYFVPTAPAPATTPSPTPYPGQLRP